MGEQERSPKKLNQNSQESELQSKQNGWIKDPNSEIYLPESYLSERKKKLAWLSSVREKTAWDWLSLLVVPALITTIAGTFTLITVSQQNKISAQQNEIFKQRDEAEKERNQQALLIEYLDEISSLVEQQLLNLNNDDNSETQRIIARARTLTVLRALDSDRKGELIQFLSAAQLIERDKPIIDLRRADLSGVDLREADLSGANLSRANLTRASLRSVNLSEADLGGTNLRGAYLSRAYLSGANFSEADLGGTNLRGAYLSRANFSKASLIRTDLSEAYLSGANFSEASLIRTDLSEADLSGANFSEASLRNTDLRNTDLYKTNLSEAYLDRVYLDGAYGYEPDDLDINKYIKPNQN